MTSTRTVLLRVGVVANVVLVAALATARAYSTPMFGSPDESAHFDYAWQVWHGGLPVFEDGLLAPITFGYRPPVQWTAQHPPLFYLLEAPFVGPLVDAGHVLAAGYAGRAASTLMAAGLVGAVMWAVAAIAPGRPELWLAAGTVTALYPLVVQVGATILNDDLFATWTALLIGLVARILRRGPTPRRLVVFALVAAAAMLTRSAAAVVLVGCAGTLGVALPLGRRWRALAGLVGALAFAVAASAWFYLRNQRLTGNLLGGHFDYLPQRVKRPLGEVVTRREVWDQLLAIHGYDLLDHVAATIVLAGVPLLLAAGLGVRHLTRHHRLVPDLALAALLVGLVGLVLLTQLRYVAAGGGASYRYLAPLTVVVSLGLAAGLLAVPRWGAWPLAAWSAFEIVPLAGFVVDSLGTPNRLSNAPVFPVPSLAAVAVGGVALVVALLSQHRVGRSPEAGAGPARRARRAAADPR